MTGRRTSVLGPENARDQAAELAAAEPTAEELWGWSLSTARRINLSALVTNNVPDAWKEVRRVWDIAQGRVRDNPAQSAGRTDVRPTQVGRSTVWVKHFRADQMAWQNNESNVLGYFARGQTDQASSLRRFVCGQSQLPPIRNGTFISTIVTDDAGPNLDSWRDFTPCSEVQGLALPLFVQANFVAAIAHRLLIGLDRLAEFEVVHNDLKPNNICMALPDGFEERNRVWQGAVNLRELPLKILDFECAFAPQLTRLVQTRDNNVWVSPFARACHNAAVDAMIRQKPHLEIQGLLAGIDWGADLWSLGHMLVEWDKARQHFLDQWLNEAREAWGVGSKAYVLCSTVWMEQGRRWQALNGLADRLMAEDRPESDAGAAFLEKRTQRPHADLWHQLQRDFPALASDAAQKPLILSLIDPSKPVSFRPDRTLGKSARARLSRAGNGIRRHAAAGLVSTAVVAAGVALWASADEITRRAVDIGNYLAETSAHAWRTEGGFYRMSTKWLAALPGGRSGVVTSLLSEPGWVDPPAEASKAAVAAYAARARQRSLRALAQWALFGGKIDQSESRAFVLRMLDKLYRAENRLGGSSQDATAARILAADIVDAEHALALLGGRANEWPLANLIQLRLWACHDAAARGDAIAALAKRLATVHDDAASAAEYRIYGQYVQERLSRGESTCFVPVTNTSSPQ